MIDWRVALAVSSGGGLGALLRYVVVTLTSHAAPSGFPLGTLIVNVSGSLAMGFLTITLVERLDASLIWRVFLLAGILGGYTTFSSFSMETVSLLQQGDYGRAIINVLSSVVLCLMATGVGIVLARQL